MKKTKERLKTRKVDNEPTLIVYTEYSSNVSSILSWYRDHNITIDTQKQWIIDAANKLSLNDRELLNRTPDCWIIDSVAYVARMFCNEVNLTERNLDYLTAKIKELIEIGRVSQERLDNRVAPIEKVKEQAQTHIDIINERIDCDPDYSVVDYITTCNLSIGYVRQIFKSLLESASKQKEDVEKWIEENKTDRKPRKKKVKSAEDICKLFVCCPEWKGFKSIKPEKIIGSDCVITYHTQKKLLGIYKGDNLTVNRSMIVNFDSGKSKTIPCDDINKLTLFIGTGKLSINKALKEFDKVETSEVTGRITDKVLILGRY
jgi:hypothetical protein